MSTVLFSSSLHSNLLILSLLFCVSLAFVSLPVSFQTQTQRWNLYEEGCTPRSQFPPKNSVRKRPLSNSLSKQERARVNTCQHRLYLQYIPISAAFWGVCAPVLVSCYDRFFLSFAGVHYNWLRLIVHYILTWSNLSVISVSKQLKLVKGTRLLSKSHGFSFVVVVLPYDWDDQ